MENKENIPVIILAGGKGTRLQEETEYRPKPMVEIGGKPILHHIMDIYSKYGFKNFIVALGYKGNMIKDYFTNYQKYSGDIEVDLINNEIHFLDKIHEDLKVTLVNTGIETLTAKRIRMCKKYVYTSQFMVTYGDGVSDVNIEKLFKFHLEHGRMATVTGVRPPSRFGELEIENEKVVSFKEKPQTTEGFINGGFFVFKAEFFNYLDCGNKMLERDPLEKAARADELRVFKHTGFWKCMDTYKDYKDLNKIWRDNAPWK